MVDIDESSTPEEMYQFLENRYEEILYDIQGLGYMDVTSSELLHFTETLLKLAKINLTK